MFPAAVEVEVAGEVVVPEVVAGLVVVPLAGAVVVPEVLVVPVVEAMVTSVRVLAGPAVPVGVIESAPHWVFWMFTAASSSVGQWSWIHFAASAWNWALEQTHWKSANEVQLLAFADAALQARMHAEIPLVSWADTVARAAARATRAVL